jgi:hypothetical protein
VKISNLTSLELAATKSLTPNYGNKMICKSGDIKLEIQIEYKNRSYGHEFKLLLNATKMFMLEKGNSKRGQLDNLEGALSYNEQRAMVKNIHAVKVLRNE